MLNGKRMQIGRNFLWLPGMGIDLNICQDCNVVSGPTGDRWMWKANISQKPSRRFEIRDLPERQRVQNSQLFTSLWATYDHTFFSSANNENGTDEFCRSGARSLLPFGRSLRVTGTSVPDRPSPWLWFEIRAIGRWNTTCDYQRPQAFHPYQ